MTDYVDVSQSHVVLSLFKAQTIVRKVDPLSIWPFSFFEQAKSIGASMGQSGAAG